MSETMEPDNEPTPDEAEHMLIRYRKDDSLKVIDAATVGSTFRKEKIEISVFSHKAYVIKMGTKLDMDNMCKELQESDDINNRNKDDPALEPPAEKKKRGRPPGRSNKTKSNKAKPNDIGKKTISQKISDSTSFITPCISNTIKKPKKLTSVTTTTATSTTTTATSTTTTSTLTATTSTSTASPATPLTDITPTSTALPATPITATTPTSTASPATPFTATISSSTAVPSTPSAATTTINSLSTATPLAHSHLSTVNQHSGLFNNLAALSTPCSSTPFPSSIPLLEFPQQIASEQSNTPYYQSYYNPLRLTYPTDSLTLSSNPICQFSQLMTPINNAYAPSDSPTYVEDISQSSMISQITNQSYNNIKPFNIDNILSSSSNDHKDREDLSATVGNHAATIDESTLGDIDMTSADSLGENSSQAFLVHQEETSAVKNQLDESIDDDDDDDSDSITEEEFVYLERIYFRKKKKLARKNKNLNKRKGNIRRVPKMQIGNTKNTTKRIKLDKKTIQEHIKDFLIPPPEDAKDEKVHLGGSSRFYIPKQDYYDVIAISPPSKPKWEHFVSDILDVVYKKNLKDYTPKKINCHLIVGMRTEINKTRDEKNHVSTDQMEAYIGNHIRGRRHQDQLKNKEEVKETPSSNKPTENKDSD